MRCPSCERKVTEDQDEGFWIRIGKCPSCGAFSWQRPHVLPEIDERAAAWSTLWWGIGWATETHERWVRGPWLTRPACACHPDLKRAPEGPASFSL